MAKSSSKAFYFVVLVLINYFSFYKNAFSVACTSRSHFRYLQNANRTQGTTAMPFNLSNDEIAIRQDFSFNKRNDHHAYNYSMDIEPAHFSQENNNNATATMLFASSVQLLNSITNVLSMMATNYLPNMYANWQSNISLDAKNENGRWIHSEKVDEHDSTTENFLKNETELSTPETTSVENITTDENRNTLNKEPVNLQMNPHNDTKTLILPIFNILKPQEVPCNTGNILLGEGVCYSESKCSGLGGEAHGRCYGGICCVFLKSCGDIVSEKRAIFQNPMYPKTFFPAQSQSEEMEINNHKLYNCHIKIEKIKNSVCQIYLYFTHFEIRGVDGAICRRDTFSVTGVNNKLPSICGNNTEHHMYLDIDKRKREVELRLSLDGNHAEGRRWSVQIQQINCNENKLVPSGCLQYHRTKGGIIRSFNYGNALIDATAGYPSGLNYAICIRKFPDSCSIRFEPRGSFQIDSSTTKPGEFKRDFICRNDYLLIPNSRPSPTNHGATFDRFCGYGFPPLLQSSSAPYVLQFVSDHSGYKDGGFQIFFQQELC